MLNTIRESWGWTGLDPAEIAAVNDFGNVIVRAADGAYWRICPEELSCDIVADSASSYNATWMDDEFQRDWQVAMLVRIAREVLGPIASDRCYCLKIPAVLGGAYDASNFGTISRHELIALAGNAGEQIKNLPDGTQFKFEFATKT